MTTSTIKPTGLLTLMESLKNKMFNLKKSFLIEKMSHLKLWINRKLRINMLTYDYF